MLWLKALWIHASGLALFWSNTLKASWGQQHWAETSHVLIPKTQIQNVLFFSVNTSTFLLMPFFLTDSSFHLKERIRNNHIIKFFPPLIWDSHFLPSFANILSNFLLVMIKFGDLMGLWNGVCACTSLYQLQGGLGNCCTLSRHLCIMQKATPSPHPIDLVWDKDPPAWARLCDDCKAVLTGAQTASIPAGSWVTTAGLTMNECKAAASGNWVQNYQHFPSSCFNLFVSFFFF